jgi:ketol-acid reductoisomerase
MSYAPGSETIGIIGYGNQGRPHALNLRDSGRDVVVGLREGSPSAERVREDGLRAVSLEAAARCDVVALLLPDERMGEVWRDHVAPVARDGQMLMFAHGFAIHFGLIQPLAGMDVALVSPKGAGKWVRAMYEAGSGLPKALGRPGWGRAQPPSGPRPSPIYLASRPCCAAGSRRSSKPDTRR